jgi:hypothetical protein
MGYKEAQAMRMMAAEFERDKQKITVGYINIIHTRGIATL